MKALLWLMLLCTPALAAEGEPAPAEEAAPAKAAPVIPKQAVTATVDGPAVDEDPCSDFQYGIGSGPAVSALEEGGLGRAHRTCGRSEVALAIDAMLAVDLANFYADIVAAGVLEGSVALGKRGEIFASFEFVRYDLVFSALTADSLGVGHLALGGSGRFLVGKNFTLAATGQVVLPTATPLYHHTRPLGFDVGVSGQFRLHRIVQLHAQASFLSSFGIGVGPTQPRAGASITVGPEVRAHPTVALGLDLHAMFGYAGPLDVFALAPAIRFSDGKRFGFEMAGTIPLAGRERAQVALQFRFSVRLGDIGGYDVEAIRALEKAEMQEKAAARKAKKAGEG